MLSDALERLPSLRRRIAAFGFSDNPFEMLLLALWKAITTAIAKRSRAVAGSPLRAIISISIVSIAAGPKCRASRFRCFSI